jgi:hypothetical protein
MVTPLDWQEKYEAIRKILIEACVRVSGSSEDNGAYVKPHIWRDAMYTGLVHGSPIVWKGWSTNLGSEYKTTYIDIVPNNLDVLQKDRLYGDEMCLAIEDISEFTIAFVTGFKEKHISLIHESGFMVRKAGSSAIHAFFILDINSNDFESLTLFTEKTAKLILLGKKLLVDIANRR